MNTLTKLFLLSLLILCPLFSSLATAQTKDLTAVTYVDKNKLNCKLSVAEKGKQGTAWIEVCDANEATFLEKKRTNTSVFLGGLITDVEINVATKKVMMKDENQKNQTYVIKTLVPAGSAAAPAAASASASAKVAKADNVNFVSYRFQGDVVELQFVDGKKWTEKWKGETYNYVEESHDEWSIYLYNKDADSRLQIDLFKKIVIYVEDGKKINSPILKALVK